jgi:Tfp pilus assembly protein PilF
VALLSIALLGAGLWLHFSRRSSAPARPRHVVLLPFENLTGDASLDWAERLIPFSLARQMEGLPGLRVLQAATPSQASAGSATHEIGGYFELRRGTLELRYLVHDARSHHLLAEGVLAVNSPWDRRLDTLAQHLLAALQLKARPRRPAFHSEAVARQLSEALAAPDAARFEAAATSDPACGPCWLGWAEFVSRSGPDAAFRTVIDGAHRRAAIIDPISLARLDLLDSTLRHDAPARLDALRRLSSALPSDPAMLTDYAEALVGARQFAKSVDAYQRALALNDSGPTLWNAYAYALAYAGRFAEAAKAARHYAELDKTGPNPFDTLGEIALLGGRFGDAAQSFTASFEKQPNFNSGLAMEKAALARMLNGNRVEAGQSLDRYLTDRAAKQDPWTLLARARWQYIFGQTAAAHDLLDRLAATPADPIAPIAAAQRALRAVAENDLPTARRSAQLARSLARTPAQLLFAALAQVAVDPELASKTFSDPAWRSESRALALTLRADWAPAAAAWREALRYSRGGSDAHQRELLALCLVSSGHAAQAAPLVDKQWPLLTREQALVYDFLILPDLFYTRAEIARAAGNDGEMHRYYGLYQQYAGDRVDRFGRLARAKTEARL